MVLEGASDFGGQIVFGLAENEPNNCPLQHERGGIKRRNRICAMHHHHSTPAGVAAGQCDLRRRQRCARLLGGYRETFPVNTSRVVVVLDGHQPAAQPRHLRRELSGFGVLFNRKHIRKIRSGEPGPQNGCHKSVYRPLRAVNAGAGAPVPATREGAHPSATDAAVIQPGAQVLAISAYLRAAPRVAQPGLRNVEALAGAGLP